MNDILNYIDEVTFRSEIDVLIAVCESYEKALAIISNEDYSEDIIQESFSIYMEDGENGFSIKALFKKVILFFKNVCAKIKGLFLRCVTVNKTKYIQSYNALLIVDELNKMFSSNIFKEYMEDQISAEVFQEGLFDRKSEQEKEEEEYMKGQVVREKELNENVKANDKALQDFVKQLRRKVFADDKFTRMLSKNDVENIVKVTCIGASKDELRKLQDAVNDITKNNNFQGIDKNAVSTIGLITTTGKSFGDAKAIKKTNSIDDYTRERAQQKIDSNNTIKAEMDIDLLERFAETFGKGYNLLSGRDYLSADNLKAVIYGSEKFITIPATIGLFTVSTVFNLLVRAVTGIVNFNPKAIIRDIEDFGKEMDVLDAEFDKFSDQDTVLRKEYGVKLNKTMALTRTAVLDNIKEETYRWEDCPFNARAYNGDMTSMIAGGPITVTVMLVAMIFFHKPFEEFLPGATSMGMMGLAKMLNPGRSGRFANIMNIGG